MNCKHFCRANIVFGLPVCSISFSFLPRVEAAGVRDSHPWAAQEPLPQSAQIVVHFSMKPVETSQRLEMEDPASLGGSDCIVRPEGELMMFWAGFHMFVWFNVSEQVRRPPV